MIMECEKMDRSWNVMFVSIVVSPDSPELCHSTSVCPEHDSECAPVVERWWPHMGALHSASAWGRIALGAPAMLEVTVIDCVSVRPVRCYSTLRT